MQQFFGEHSKQGVTGGMSNIEHLDDDPKFTIGDKVTSSAHLESSSLEAVPGPFRYHDANRHWCTRIGVVYTTPNPLPVTGVKNHTKITPIPIV